MSSNRPPLEQLAGTSYKRLVDFVSSRSHSQHFERRRKGVRVDAYISSVSKSQSLWPILGRAKRLQLLPASSRGPKMRASSAAVQAVHAQSVAAANKLASLPALVVAACTALVFLAAAAICIFLIMRPLLKRLESLAVACEAAAKEVEKASAEFALASGVINNDLPTTLDSMERASLEFEELGQSLNSLTGALRRPKPPAAKPGAKGKGQGLAKTEGEKPAEAEGSESPAAAALGEMSAVEAIQAGTVNSMRKVAQDVSALAAALHPAMSAWRKRLGFITERFEAAGKQEKLKELPALSEANKGNTADKTSLDPVSILQAAQSVSDSAEESMDASDWGKDVRSLQERVMSQAESGEVSSVANQLAKAASEVADVARASLSSTDEGQPANFGLSPEEHKEGADLLEKAAKAAEALTREAQKAAEVESKFKALKDISPFPENYQGLSDLPGGETDVELEGELEDRRQAAEAVFAALANAEEAASAAAAASGALETALQKAEQQAGVSWWGWNGSLFRPSARKKREEASESLDPPEPQEHDGMAYPCNPYIEARGAKANKDDAGSESNAGAEVGKS